jgi:hypothetical protein
MTSINHPVGSGHHYTDEEMHNVDVAHEHTDANIRMLLAFGGAILALVAVAAALMYGLFQFLAYQAAERDPELSPHAVINPKPQGPKLIENEPQYLREFRQEETSKLQGGGWMNQAGGVAFVPLDFAKKMVVQHGLPVRADAATDARLGTNAPAYGESSGGRAIRARNAAPPAAAGGEPHAADAAHPPAGPHGAPAAGQEIKK